MSYNSGLEKRIDVLIRRWKGVEKKKMFGGICCLLNGNMCFGIHKDFLIIRAGKEREQALMAMEGTRPFDITGKVMRGWVMVSPEGFEDDGALNQWLEIGKTYAKTLPPKKTSV